MSIFNIMNVAAMGMTAQNIRLNTISSNLSNAESTAGSEETAYKALQPVFNSQPLHSEDSSKLATTSIGVKVTNIIHSKKPIQNHYDPFNPIADEKGLVYMSNVNLIHEMADMVAASRAYQNCAQLVNNAIDLMKQTINIGK